MAYTWGAHPNHLRQHPQGLFALQRVGVSELLGIDVGYHWSPTSSDSRPLPRSSALPMMRSRPHPPDLPPSCRCPWRVILKPSNCFMDFKLVITVVGFLWLCPSKSAGKQVNLHQATPRHSPKLQAPSSCYKWGEITPINGRKSMGKWGTYRTYCPFYHWWGSMAAWRLCLLVVQPILVIFPKKGISFIQVP